MQHPLGLTRSHQMSLVGHHHVMWGFYLSENDLRLPAGLLVSLYFGGSPSHISASCCCLAVLKLSGCLHPRKDSNKFKDAFRLPSHSQCKAAVAVFHPSSRCRSIVSSSMHLFFLK